ncbi:Methionine import ATP-binding protein MetN [bioreactor metagenome]|uniref:Methionine import ATP-binding protein MetN n=1 Tax=bioreactor metagenome TaxID=1076179 RepID=A0A645G7C3_9ZZZZ
MQRTVGQNIAFPLELQHTEKEAIKDRVEFLAKLVGLEEKINTYPSQLSGGQKQRVAIARALATNPKILLCDEPTSALDSLTTKSILRLLQDINRQFHVTILIITHEMGVVKSICNKVAVIDNSILVEQGFTKEILANPRSSIARMLLGIEGGDAQ